MDASGPKTVEQIVAERNGSYAEAWKLTGHACKVAGESLGVLLTFHPEMYLPWVTIMCKLFRILGSPTNPDHWKDIAGYATLVIRDLEQTNGNIPSK